eukprot:gene5740-6443_t
MLITGRLCPARFTLEAQRNADADVVAHASQKLCSRKTGSQENTENTELKYEKRGITNNDYISELIYDQKTHSKNSLAASPYRFNQANQGKSSQSKQYRTCLFLEHSFWLACATTSASAFLCASRVNLAGQSLPVISIPQLFVSDLNSRLSHHSSAFCELAIETTKLPVSPNLPSPTKYEVVIPNHLHSTRQRRDLSTFTKDGHLDETSFSFTSKEKTFVLDVYLNRYLFHKDFFSTYQLPDGNLTENENPVENCYYHGSLSGNANTSVVLSTCDGLRGTIKDHDGKVYGIEPQNDNAIEHLFYDMEDMPMNKSKCGVDHENLDIFNNLGSHLRIRRAASLAGSKKYISMALVNDKRQLAKTINARVPLVYVETWNVTDKIHVQTTASSTLGLFGGYNRNVLSKTLAKKKIRRDNAQLITGITFDGSVVGMAGIGTICGIDSSGVNSDHGSVGSTASTVAHEMGHNLGMPHDTWGCTCTKGPCVMSAVSSSAAHGFTSCSKSAFDNRVKDGLGSCLFDVPPKLFGPPVCGNDFLEAGEECDCGTEAECNATGASACCNAKSCTLHNNAQCAIGPCCSGCKFKKQGTLCRSRQTECDLEEVCVGNSAECPGNFYRVDGVPCRNNTMYKVSCKNQSSRRLSCTTFTLVLVCVKRKIIAGFSRKLGQVPKWDMNAAIMKTQLGPNGQIVDRTTRKFIRDAPKKTFFVAQFSVQILPIDFLFLVLAIRHELLDITSISMALGQRLYAGVQGVTHMGDDLDNPTLVQQGTKCNEGKICMSNKCVNLTSLDLKTCPENACHNGGICNNMGHCHCPAGFACPDCKHPGQGGSIDSGNLCYVAPTVGTSTLTMTSGGTPTSVTRTPTGGKPTGEGTSGSNRSTLTKSMLILFLGVLPVVFIVVILLYKFRSKLPCRTPAPMLKYIQRHQPSLSRQSLDKSNVADVPEVYCNKSAVEFSPPPAHPNAYSSNQAQSEPSQAPPHGRPPTHDPPPFYSLQPTGTALVPLKSTTASSRPPCRPPAAALKPVKPPPAPPKNPSPSPK